jgi:hypothetical protein
MSLSESERSFIKAEQRRQSRWRWTRWVNATVSLFVVVASGVNMKRLATLIGNNGMPESVVLWFWPFCWIVLLSFSSRFVYTLAHWRGDLATALLLRLAQEHDREAKENP